MAHSYASAQQPATPAERSRILWRNRLSYLPLGLAHFAVVYSFVVLHAVALAMSLAGLESSGAGSAGYPAAVDFLMVVWIGPNMLRSFCINFVSSNLHYCEDNEPRNPVQQAQVWTAAWTWPFQMFCFNFGGTHAIHHFLVRDPFYVRQLMAKRAHVVLRHYGVRFNDFETFWRANRWTKRLPRTLVAEVP